MMPNTKQTPNVPSPWVALLLAMAAAAQRTVHAFQVLPPTNSVVTSRSEAAAAAGGFTGRTFTRTTLQSTVKFDDPPEDENDCGDECEIDWDAMPSFEDFEEEEKEEGKEAEAPTSFYNDFEGFEDDINDDDDDDDFELEVQNIPTTTKGRPSVEHRRVHMEMQWQLMEASQECVVEEPETCGSEECTDCNGRGWSDCRFCHGTAVLKIDKAKFAAPTAELPTTMADSLLAGTGASTTATTSKKFILPSSFSACKICHQGVEMCKRCQGSGWVAGWTQIPNEDPLKP